MEGQKDKVNQRKVEVTAAINKIANTEAGIIFFKWLKEQCHFERSTISGNPVTYEVNELGSIAQEFQRQLYLKIRRGFKAEAKIRIEIDQDKPE